MRPLIAVFASAATVALVLTPTIRAVARRTGTLDHPSERRTHNSATPRPGGIAIAAAWAGTLIAFARYGNPTIRAAIGTMPLVPILVGSLLVFAVGLLDDLRSVPASVKLIAEVLGASALVGAGLLISHVTMFGIVLPFGWLSVVITMVWIVGITNAFNLVDGLDGLATGLAIIAGATCTAIVIIRGERGTAAVLVALLGGLVGFLPFNFNPASIFLGDSGSLLIGFVLALTAITGFQKGATALAVGVPLLIFALPIVDIVNTIARRLRRSNGARDRSLRKALSRLVQPDQEHIHHRLMARGLSHRSAVLVLYAIALGLAGIAFITMERS